MCLSNAKQGLGYLPSDLPRTLPPPTHTIESKGTKNSTLEWKENGQKSINSHHKNVNKSKNRLTPLKLGSKKHDKKVMALREGSGMGLSNRSSRKSHVPSRISLGRLFDQTQLCLALIRQSLLNFVQHEKIFFKQSRKRVKFSI